MAESKRSANAGAWRKALLLLAVAAGPGLACKSTSSEAPPPSSGTKIMGPAECPAELLLPAEGGSYVLSCTGMSPESLKITAKGPVTFSSSCAKEVTISFSDPSTLFEEKVPFITLAPNESKTVTLSDNKGCHILCYDTLVCPPPGDITSKTGSLDVYTDKPAPKNPPQ